MTTIASRCQPCAYGLSRVLAYVDAQAAHHQIVTLAFHRPSLSFHLLGAVSAGAALGLPRIASPHRGHEPVKLCALDAHRAAEVHRPQLALLDLPLDAPAGPPQLGRDLVEVEEEGWLDVVCGVHIPLRIRGMACGPFPTPSAVFTTPVSPGRLERPPRNFGSHSGSLEAL